MKLLKILSLRAFALGSYVLVGGCGSFGSLEPQAGKSLPVKAYSQNDEQSADRLLKASPQARPNREQEILSRSTVRSEDPFDLPPEGDNAVFPDYLKPIEDETDGNKPKDEPVD